MKLYILVYAYINITYAEISMVYIGLLLTLLTFKSGQYRYRGFNLVIMVKTEVGHVSGSIIYFLERSSFDG